MNLKATPFVPEIPTQENKLLERLNAIDATQNDALQQVKDAIDKNYNWDRQEVEKYCILIDTIIGDFHQIVDPSTTNEEKHSLYAEVKDYVNQLPITSGLRAKVEEIVSIPELDAVV